MKVIEVKHTVCDYKCMWNGVADLYTTRTGFNTPPYFFFGLSGLCNPAFIKVSKSDAPRMFYFSSGVAARMYLAMANIVGFDYSVIENRSFRFSLRKAKQQIDKGNPVIIGATDMFHLEYHEKFFHKLHIPIHYFLMVGYDDEKENIFLYDCGKQDIQELSYSNLKKAWDVDISGLSKKNTLFIFNFKDEVNDVKAIFFKALKEKVNTNLHARINIIGLKAFRKLASEINSWDKELTKEQYEKCLLHVVEYAGFPPFVPDDYTKINTTHDGGRFAFANLLKWGADAYYIPELKIASDKFIESGKLINILAYQILKCVQEQKPLTREISKLILSIVNCEEEAYKIIDNITELS